jgi:putative phage-type endonuclease
MRRVGSHNDPVWRAGGIGSSDAPALLNAGFGERDTPLYTWAAKVQMRDRQVLKEMRKCTTLVQDSPEWHQWRLDGIGGSEIAGLVGKSKYTNPQEIWRNKTQPKAVNDKPESPAMKRGKQLEPDARKLYEAVFGWEVPPLCCISDEHDCIRASLDGIRGDDQVIIEVKCMGRQNHDCALIIETIEDPVGRNCEFEKFFNHYAVQCQYQLLITQAKVCHFVSYSPDFPAEKRMAVVELKADPLFQDVILSRCLDFWHNYVVPRVPPPIGW